MAEQLNRVDEALTRLSPTLDAEGEDGTGTPGKVLPGQLVVAVRVEAGVLDVLDCRMLLQILSGALSVGDVAVHPHVKGLETLQQQPGGERRHGGSVVAQHLRPALQQPAEVAEILEEP